MTLRARAVRDHPHWEMVNSRRSLTYPRTKVLLSLGRLDCEDPLLLEQKRQQARVLGDRALALRFHASLSKFGYPTPVPSLQDVDLATIRSHEPELTLVKLSERLGLAELIEGGAPREEFRGWVRSSSLSMPAFAREVSGNSSSGIAAVLSCTFYGSPRTRSPGYGVTTPISSSSGWAMSGSLARGFTGSTDRSDVDERRIPPSARSRRS